MLIDFKQQRIELATDSSQCYGMDMKNVVKDLNKLLSKLNLCFQKEQNNFAEICYYVFKVNELFKTRKEELYYGRFLDKHSNFVFFKDIMKGFGLDETQTSRILACYDKYVSKETEKPILLGQFFRFSKSKLYELLQVPNEQIEKDLKSGLLSSEMAVDKIRQYVKNYKTMLKHNKKLSEQAKAEEPETTSTIEEEIPEAYNPTKYYEFSYFESKSKSQLLNIVWELQNAYTKLKQEKKK